MLTKTLKTYPLSLLCSLAIVVLSLAPIGAPEVAPDVPFLDKWTHCAMYGVLSLLLFWEGRNTRSTWMTAAIIVYACLLGGLMEIAQATLTTYRSGEWLDFVADSLGALLGAAVERGIVYIVRTEVKS